MSWEEDCMREDQSRRSRAPQLELPSPISLSFGRSDEQLADAGFKIYADVDGKGVVWSIAIGFSNFLRSQDKHKKTIENIRYIADTRYEFNPSYHEFRFIMGEIDWDEVLKLEAMHYKFSRLFSRKFDADTVKSLIKST